MFYKEIICLANSRKWGGRCVAGKEDSTGEWIRPISNRVTGELRVSDIRYENRESVELLDIVEIPFEQVQPETYQPENILISNQHWWKRGEYSKDELDALCDNPSTIWTNKHPSSDRIDANYLEQNPQESSLLFIKVDQVKIRLLLTDYGQGIKKQVRALFSYNGQHYNLVVTDPEIEEKYLRHDEGDYPLEGENIYMCISLGGPYRGDCYKLVASIIR
ncbi:MAG TPA: hypothetical protein VMW40_02120 [Candidatus Bathyarchaeia archaeon]|nr:hypothetical protein [Candidatus Bathyarchaeia archaeon]